MSDPPFPDGDVIDTACSVRRSYVSNAPVAADALSGASDGNVSSGSAVSRCSAVADDGAFEGRAVRRRVEDAPDVQALAEDRVQGMQLTCTVLGRNEVITSEDPNVHRVEARPASCASLV